MAMDSSPGATLLLIREKPSSSSPSGPFSFGRSSMREASSGPVTVTKKISWAGSAMR